MPVKKHNNSFLSQRNKIVAEELQSWINFLKKLSRTQHCQVQAQDIHYWIKSLDLMEYDKDSLLMGEWLNDKHIFACSRLLKKQYPHQKGLQSTQLLAKKLEWKQH